MEVITKQPVKTLGSGHNKNIFQENSRKRRATHNPKPISSSITLLTKLGHKI